ncbi:MAG: hypothetical protein JXR94_03380 [Candidatus Hydrogenedentes bacterium]|nr:hypothetical protein [Candidatus Hydrogenedentota bacterium]
MSRLIVPGCLLLIACVPAGSAGAGARGLEAEFRTPTQQSRRLLGPLFWLHGDESAEHLDAYVGIVAEGGNGCFTAESRPHADWLGEGWYRDLGVCLDAAKRLGLEMWIFDERWWPSGEVGGKVPVAYASKYLQVESVDVSGPGACTVAAPDAHLVAVVAAKRVGDKVDGDSLIDLTGAAAGGELEWAVPAGDWRVLVFTWEPAKVGSRYLVDGASQEAVDWYLDTVYRPHYERFRTDFGKTIKGFFYDEPETHGDWGTEVIPTLKRRGADWKQALVAFKCGLADAEAEVAAKYAYITAFGEAWGRTLYGGITAWCRARGVESIGHFLEHRYEYRRPDLCGFDMVALQKYSSMGGIDAVFRQFTPGDRDLRQLYTPKLGSSISHAYGVKNDLAMVEIYGARGQDLGYLEMKWWLDVMQVQGINFIIPHSFNPRAPFDTDCPPYFYNNGFEPRWPLYKVWADYSVRLSGLLSGGKHVAPVAFVYPGVSGHVGEALLPEPMTDALLGGLLDCDWMPYEVFEEDAALRKGAVALREERYRILLLPAVEAIPYGTLEKAKAFFDRGGIVAGYGMLPSKSATVGRSSADIAALVSAIWGEGAQPGTAPCAVNGRGGRAYFLPAEPASAEVRAAFVEDAGVAPALDIVDGATDDWVHILHRRKSGVDIFFVANLNCDEAVRPFRFRAHVPGVPEVWDAMRNEIAALPFERRAGAAEFELALAPYESVVLVFNPKKRDLPGYLTDAAVCALDTVALTATPVPPGPDAVPEPEAEDSSTRLGKGQWIWHAADPVGEQPPGTRYFRKAFEVARAVESAVLVVAVDNSYTLEVNGKQIGSGGRWDQADAYDVAAVLAPGENRIAIAAVNGAEAPNPAGVIAVLDVVYDNSEGLRVATDGTWLSAREPDGDWAPAKAIGPYGIEPWGAAGRRLTLSPVRRAEPFEGYADLPEATLNGARRVFLTAESVDTEPAARVTVNGAYAGGFIGAPLRLDVTRHLHAGRNTVRIEPLAPAGVALRLEPGR